MSGDHYQGKCKICDRHFDFGPHAYRGKYLPRCKMTVCDSCLSAHRDGWNQEAETRIVDHLVRNELTVPERNVAGWLPAE